ncbi:MAG TPA: arginine--tRNA ligase [Polyangia bacterium]|nr:arginine--tRNA ligase [Polyangia bacterium]
MINPVADLRKHVTAAVQRAFPEQPQEDPAVHRSVHADYQADVALGLGRRLKKPPREVGTAIAGCFPDGEVAAAPVVSGPGFLNLTLKPAYLSARLHGMLADPRLGFPPVAHPEVAVVDYSGPNVAKEMHVGHLRSTIIGDAIARVLAFQGHRVIRQNHIGDWGTPFGMLIEYLLEQQISPSETSLAGLAAAYRQARGRFDADAGFADRARARVVLLQAGDADTRRFWDQLIATSVQHFSKLYELLGVTLGPADIAGESRYNDSLAALTDELLARGLARVSEGAVCTFPAGFSGRDGAPVPLIIRKSDGGYGYAATDLAALRYRIDVLKARRLVYVVGAPQSQHLAMVFATAREAGWADDSVQLQHVAFGSVLGADKKMFKSRAGEAVTLSDLLTEGLNRAEAVIRGRTTEGGAGVPAGVARMIGIGAIKYADLLNDRVKDYVFDWDRMLAFEGNTAPYIMYAHARCRSILRKAGGYAHRPEAAILVDAAAERALALELLSFDAAIERAAEALQPHRLCQSLHDVAVAFTAFFEHCPVLTAAEPARQSRLALCELTSRVLAHGLGLLGIDAPEQM